MLTYLQLVKLLLNIVFYLFYTPNPKALDL